MPEHCPEIVTLQGNGCQCATPSLKPGEQMTTALTDYVRHLIADGCAVVVEHPDVVRKTIDAGHAIDATDKARSEK